MDQHEYGAERPGVGHFVTSMKTRRAALNISQTELARLLTAHPSNDSGIVFYQATIQRIETGERPVKLFEAIWIASTLQSDLLEMLEGEDLSGAYRDLVDEVRPENMEWILDNAEAVSKTIRRTVETIGNQINNYRQTVSETPGSEENLDLIRVAHQVEELHRRLIPSSMKYSADIHEVIDECARIPRPYPRSFQPEELDVES